MNRVILYAASERGPLGWSWAAWAKVQSARGWKSIGAKSWNEVGEYFRQLALDGDKIGEVQFWGHGQPGGPLIAGGVMPSHVTERLSQVVTPESLVWFRMCSVFFGEKGREFAEVIAQRLGCRVAAHTRIIGPWHSGLFSVGPDAIQWHKRPWETGQPDNWRDWKSSRTAWHTVFCTTMKIPESW